MIKETEKVLNRPVKQDFVLGTTVTLVESGLDQTNLKKMYKKLKNEGKCCEGGSEGWSG